MVLYFSGTGNSRSAARQIADRLGDGVVSLNDRIKSGDDAPLHSQLPFVVVTPTYAWQIPRLVAAHLRATAFSGDRRAYFVMTCGDDIGNAGASLRALCDECGLTFMGVAGVVMPENYIAMYDVPDARTAAAIRRRAQPVIEAIGQTIARGEPLPTHAPSILDRIKSGAVNRFFYPVCVNARGFHVTDKCVGCGLCEAVCPTGTVYLAGGKPRWSVGCTHCMACICRCPQAAIEYRKVSQKRQRYYLPEDPQ